MQIDHKLPNNTKECIRLLEYMGFVKKDRIGKGNHQYKYFHPTRKCNCPNEKPFIIIPTYYYKQISEHIYTKLICYGFSREEIKEACENV